MVRYRTQCSCGKIQDFKSETAICSRCNANLLSQTEGRLTLYRKATYVGCENNFTVFLNNVPLRELRSNQTVTYCLPYGAYTVHFSCGYTKKCKDITVELTEEKKEVCLLTMVKMKMWKNVIIIEEWDKEEFTWLK